MSKAESLPETNNNLGDALHAAMTGQESPTVAAEPLEPEPSLAPRATDLDSLADAELETDTPVTQTAEGEPVPEAGEPEAEVGGDFPEVELKVKGVAEPVKVKLDPNSEDLRSLLNKGKRFDKVMSQTAQQRKDLEAKLANLGDYAEKAEVADRVQAAKEFMEQGYSEHALNLVLGDAAESFIDTLIEERVAYQNASPEERLKIDIERQKRNEQLRRKQDEDRIAKLEAQINARSESAREAEFKGYVEDAKSRYDLSNWVADGDTANDLNEMLNAAAMADIIKLQRQREAKGENNITQQDIRRAYATRAKRLIEGYRRQTKETADQTIAEQSEVATKNAQVASTRNYGKTDALENWKKSGGGMSDLVDALRRGGKGII